MTAFDFGSNWQAYSDKQIGAQTLEAAIESLQRLLQRDDLRGLSFLDVGCGSGLFAIAACKLGAVRVVGIDVNPRCITVSRQNSSKLLSGVQIDFVQANVLCPSDLLALGTFDIVYAWGSLHHTGAVWEAIRNTTKAVASHGTLVLAIYNKHFTSSAWKCIKWLYNQLPPWGQRIMVFPLASAIYAAKFVVTRRNPLEKERGMDFWYDVIDWVGGYPYEYANPMQVKGFLAREGFIQRYFVPAQVPTGCNEFVFMAQVT